MWGVFHLKLYYTTHISMLDQYVSNSEVKWGRTSSITLFLPGGYEGIGPEHCSMRLERFLQMSANKNWRICYPTEASQFFHLIRMQALQQHNKRPLIVCTPKSMLRLPVSFSAKSAFTERNFQLLLVYPQEMRGKARRLIVCTGKIYYDLLKQIEQDGIQDVVIVRIEQLYPLNVEYLQEVLHHHKSYREIVWVQEEPKNQGAWPYIKGYLRRIAASEKAGFHYVGRPVSDTTESTYGKAHKKEQEEIAVRALHAKFSKGDDVEEDE